MPPILLFHVTDALMGAASRRINSMHLIRERVAVYIAVMVALAIVVMRRTVIPYLVVPIRRCLLKVFAAKLAYR